MGLPEFIESLAPFGIPVITLIFIYAVIRLYIDCNAKVDTKDADLKELNNRVLDSLNKNTQVMSELKSTIRETSEKNQSVLENNTKAMNTLSDRIYDVIKK